MRWWLRWIHRRRHHIDSISAAQSMLAELEARDQQIDELGHQMREAKLRNHFSETVQQTLRRLHEERNP